MAANREGEQNTYGIGGFDAKYRMKKFQFNRPATGDNMVRLDVKFAGMCHSDLHTVNTDWGVPDFPVCPGHEIAGLVTEVGKDVQKFKVGDRVGVGCMVLSCKECAECKNNNEQFCENGTGRVYTYAAKYPGTDRQTIGGYSTQIVVDQHFVCKIPEKMKMELAAPLLCAGITTYSPLQKYVKKGDTIAVAGFGGLGMTACKVAKAMGCEVFVFSRNNKKQKEIESVGAKLLIAADKDELKKQSRTVDFILDTIPFEHDIGAMLEVLKVGGTLCMVGAGAYKLGLGPGQLIGKQLKVVGSLIGGMKETHEMLEFFADNDITLDIKIIDATQVTEALDILHDGSVAYRQVIDMSTIDKLAMGEADDAKDNK